MDGSVHMSNCLSNDEHDAKSNADNQCVGDYEKQYSEPRNKVLLGQNINCVREDVLSHSPKELNNGTVATINDDAENENSTAADLCENGISEKTNALTLNEELSSKHASEDDSHDLSVQSRECIQAASEANQNNEHEDHKAIKKLHSASVVSNGYKTYEQQSQVVINGNKTCDSVETANPNKSDSNIKFSSPSKGDKDMQNLIHQNLENISPKKEAKPVISESSLSYIEDRNVDQSDRPIRVNPFNQVHSNADLSTDIWQMQRNQNPPSSMSLQSLSSYQQQMHPSISSTGNSLSQQNFKMYQNDNMHIQNQSPYKYNNHPQFDLMPPLNRVRPVSEPPTEPEDVDSIVNEVESSQSEPISDPWVKMDQPENNICEPLSLKNSVRSPRNDHQSDQTSVMRKQQERLISHREQSISQLEEQQRSIPHQVQQGRPPCRSMSYERPLIEAAGPCDPADLIEGIIFTAYYLGSTQLQSERNPGKSARMLQAQEAVSRIKAPEGESQPSVEVDLFISTDRVKVLNADTQEPMMDHTLRSISYIADIGKLLVIMAKRRAPHSENEEQSQIVRDPKPLRSYRIICHVFSSPDAQLMAQAIGQSFNVAYQQFLTANGIEPQTLTRDDYNQLLDMQEMYHDDLVHYSNRENVKDIWIEKNKGENLGVVIVESGWGSIVPTVILANLQHGGPAERCGKLSIGDQIMTVNGTSLVGLPLTTCQSIIKGLRSQSIARLNIVSCPPVVTVLIKRPDLKYQLGFSVQDGIICSLMRGGIAERGGVRVGHRIIEINGQSVVATAHEKIVQTLVSSVGEIQMKTMPAMMYRLLTGQEQPIYI